MVFFKNKIGWCNYHYEKKTNFEKHMTCCDYDEKKSYNCMKQELKEFQWEKINKNAFICNFISSNNHTFFIDEK